jgi:hypothetical protein
LDADVLSALLDLEALRRQPWRQSAATRAWALARTVQLTKACPDWHDEADRVRAVLRGVWRASSLVECVNSVARMQQANGTRERCLARFDAEHLSANTAQSGQLADLGSPGTVDHAIIVGNVSVVRNPEYRTHAGFLESGGQPRECLSRIEMRFMSKEQCATETACEIRFKRRDRLLVQPFPSACPVGKAVEFASIAPGRHDKCSPAMDMAGQRRLPPIGGKTAERQYRLLRAFPFAPWRQHAPGKAGCASPDCVGMFNDTDPETVPVELPGNGEAGNAGSLDENVHRHSPVGVFAASAIGM